MVASLTSSFPIGHNGTPWLYRVAQGFKGTGEAPTGELILCLFPVHKAFLPPLTQRRQRRTYPSTKVGFVEEDLDRMLRLVKATLAVVELVWTEMVGIWFPLASFTIHLFLSCSW